MSRSSRTEPIPQSVARKLAVRIGHGQEAVAIGSRAGVVEWTNSAWERITGWAVEQSVSKPITRLLAEIGLERDVLDYVQAHFLAGRRSSLELPVDTPDGRTLWIHLEVEPYRDESGEITDFVAVATDITERRLAEQALERHLRRQGVDPAADAGGERESMRDADALRGLAAESIRATRALRAMADRLDAHGELSPDAEALAAELRDCLDPVLARLAPAPVAEHTVDVGRCVAGRCRELVPVLPEHALIDLAVSNATPHALADGDVVADVVGDLLEESLGALSGTWGTLSVTVGPTEPGQPLASEVYHTSFFGTLSDEDPRIFIELHDTAQNVPPKDLERIAAPLLPDPPEGRVFTLLRSRIRIEEMGGEMHVSATPGCGTRVLILLPVAEGDAPARD